jgi:hypothetical protein
MIFVSTASVCETAMQEMNKTSKIENDRFITVD